MLFASVSSSQPSSEQASHPEKFKSSEYYEVALKLRRSILKTPKEKAGFSNNERECIQRRFRWRTRGR